MKHGFLILAHKNPLQLERLVNYLLLQNCYVFVHIDKKSARLFSEYIGKYKNAGNLQIYSEYEVYWGSYNQIRATFLLLEKAIEVTGLDYISLISAQDLPLKSIKTFSEFLTLRPKDYFTFFPVPENDKIVDNGGLDRYRLHWITDFNPSSKWFFDKWNVLVHLFQNTFKVYKKSKLKLYGGTNWFTISKNTANYVNNYVRKNTEFLRSFKNTRCADELILQTIIMNSDLAGNAENKSLRMVDWKTGPEYPRVYRNDDYKRLLDSDCFFARKFDETIDIEIIDKIYSHLLIS